MLKKLLGLSIATIGALALFVSTSNAAVLKNARVTMSNPIQAATGVTHGISFHHIGSSFGSFQALYCEDASGACTATGADLDDAAKTTIVNPSVADEAGTWGVAAGDTGNNRIRIARNEVETNAAGTWTLTFSTITNPDINSCNPAPNTQPQDTHSTTTCYVRLTTYSDTSYSTAADTSTVSLTVTQAVLVTATVDPSFTLVISGIRPSQTATANSTTLTSAITSTITTIPFGNLTPGTPKYAGQSLTVTTNAVGGYSITAVMSQNMTGLAYGSDIDAFAGGGATVNSASASWTSPTGTASGTDSGWLGVGSNDTNTNALGRGNNQFWPLGTTAQTVANSNTSAQNRMSILAYAIEVNAYQQADSYTGRLRYNALPVY